MTVKTPRAGEPVMLTKPHHGKYMYRQEFFYDDGRKEEYTLWGYPKRTASIVFPLTRNRKVLVIRQFRHGANKFIAEIPGGNPNREESPETVADRELLEETGYKADKIISVGPEYYFEPGYFNAKFIPLLAIGCYKRQDLAPDKNEVIELVLISLEEWYRMVWKGEVLDSKTLAISLLVMPHLNLKPQF